MTREEQILSEAKKYYCDDINCHNAFLHGVEWSDEHPKNVWHDASEEPIYGRDIIAENINGYALSGAFRQVENNKGVFYNNFCLCDWSVVIKWMYVFDILPGGGQ